MRPSQREICPLTSEGSLKLFAAHIENTVNASAVPTPGSGLLEFKFVNAAQRSVHLSQLNNVCGAHQRNRPRTINTCASNCLRSLADGTRPTPIKQAT